MSNLPPSITDAEPSDRAKAFAWRDRANEETDRANAAEAVVESQLGVLTRRVAALETLKDDNAVAAVKEAEDAAALETRVTQCERGIGINQQHLQDLKKAAAEPLHEHGEPDPVPEAYAGRFILGKFVNNPKQDSQDAVPYATARETERRTPNVGETFILDRDVRITRSSSGMVLVSVPPEGSKLIPSIAHAMQVVLDQGLARSGVRLRFELSPGDYEAFRIADGTKHGADYVSARIFDADQVHVACTASSGSIKLAEGLQDSDPKLWVPLARIHGSIRIGSRNYGDGGVRSRAHLLMWEVEHVLDETREGLNINTGQEFWLDQHKCHRSIHPDADPTKVKWGSQLYSVSLHRSECSSNLAGIQEHDDYAHGHAAGRGWMVQDYLTLGCGGQPFQWTHREYEAPFAPPMGIHLKRCILTGFGKDAGRAGSAVTLAGAGEKVVLEDVLVYDFDPTDTVDQPSNIEGTNYGAITMWTPNTPDQAWEQYNGGKGNVALTLLGCLFVIAKPNRPVGNFRDAQRLTVKDTRFLATEGGKVQVNNPAYGQRPIDEVVWEEGKLPDLPMRWLRALASSEGAAEQYIVCTIEGLPPTD